MEEEYKKKYEDALDRAKDCHVKKHFNEVDDTLQDICEYIFPELKESEDERIRKGIIKFFTENEVTPTISYEAKQAWIAWLKKQKVNTDGDFARGYDCGYQCCLNSHGAEWLEKRKEQKPIVMNTPRYSPPEQKPAEWSERDKEYLNQAIETLEHEGYEILATALKSINPQPKVEWSEEDEKMKERLITRLNWITYNTRTDGTSPNITFFDEIDWLKSLRPQPHWKPSEEQMEALDVALKMFPKDAPYRQRLESLYNDLKKQ